MIRHLTDSLSLSDGVLMAIAGTNWHLAFWRERASSALARLIGLI